MTPVPSPLKKPNAKEQALLSGTNILSEKAGIRKKDDTSFVNTSETQRFVEDLEKKTQDRMNLLSGPSDHTGLAEDVDVTDDEDEDDEWKRSLKESIQADFPEDGSIDPRGVLKTKDVSFVTKKNRKRKLNELSHGLACDWLLENKKEVQEFKKRKENTAHLFDIFALRGEKAKFLKEEGNRGRKVILTHALPLFDFCKINKLTTDKIGFFEKSYKFHTAAGAEKIAEIKDISDLMMREFLEDESDEIEKPTTIKDTELGMLDLKFSKTWWKLPNPKRKAHGGKYSEDGILQKVIEKSRKCLPGLPASNILIELVGIEAEKFDGTNDKPENILFIKPIFKYSNI